MGLVSLLQPQRLRHRSDAREFARHCSVSQVSPTVDRIRVHPLEVDFFWPAPAAGHLWHPIEQETSPLNPHHYTTDPIRLGPESVVIDVGACEGLFAFRLLRQGLAREVIAFEPFPAIAELLRRGVEFNGFTGRIRHEPYAVGNHEGVVGFRTDLGADSSQVVLDPPEGFPGVQVQGIRIDDYLARTGRRLTSRDLIKIDAEGADFDVLRGAEQTLRRDAPQIAVTTYHADEHADVIVRWLREVQPRYRFRLKGFSFWTATPRPVLLQAATDRP